MEDVYTLKVKTKPDTRNLYPSERRYSASTVSGLAWVHIALAATSFLLTCLTLLKQSTDENIQIKLNATEEISNNNSVLINLRLDLNENITDAVTSVGVNNDNAYVLVVASTLLTVFALLAGIASVLASVRWYIDRNITWVFIMSILSTVFAFICFVMVLVWFITSTDEKDELSDIFKDKEPFEHYFVAKVSDVVVKNDSHLVIGRNGTNNFKDNKSYLFSKRVLSLNILIAAFLEFLWSILSIKIAYKGMRSNYKDSDERSNDIEVVTTYKGNSNNKPRDGILQSKPDLINHCPNRNIKRIFLSQDDNGFYLKNEKDVSKKSNTETSSEFYKERMINFLNGCTIDEGRSEIRTPSIQSEANISPETPVTPKKDRPISWGDTPEHTIYNQNNINFDKIFKVGPRINESKVDGGLETSEIVKKD